ncbi:MAG: amidase domain-containing protein [Ruminococcus sp.]
MKTNIFHKGISLLLTVLLLLGMEVVMPMNQASASGYDASAAVSYAKTYWSHYNPNYANYNDIGGDCANFVSQCLHAGGLEMTDGWYWYSYSDRSASWAACPSMYKYFKEAGYTIIENPSDSQVLAGNPVLYYSSAKGRWSHAAICVGNDSSGTPIVAAHNNDHYGVDWKLGTGWSKRCTILMNQNTTEKVSI